RQQQLYSHLANNNFSNGQNSHIFCYGDPHCWTQLCLNHSKAFRRLRD
ncbi:unnamed protein product, partial [Rotaria sordida]